MKMGSNVMLPQRYNVSSGSYGQMNDCKYVNDGEQKTPVLGVVTMSDGQGDDDMATMGANLIARWLDACALARRFDCNINVNFTLVSKDLT